MDKDPLSQVEDAESEKKKSRFNNHVAVTIALLATFMAICKVKDHNINTAMQAIQVSKIDHWATYQATHTRSNLASDIAIQLRLQEQSQSPPIRAAYNKQIAALQRLSRQQMIRSNTMRLEVGKLQSEYNDLDLHDDQFDLSEAAFSIAIAMLALSALTQKRWLYALSMLPALFGFVLGLAGLGEVDIHIRVLEKLLGP